MYYKLNQHRRSVSLDYHALTSPKVNDVSDKFATLQEKRDKNWATEQVDVVLISHVLGIVA